MPEKNDGFLVNDVMRAFGGSGFEGFRDGQSIRYPSDMLPVSNGERLDRDVNAGQRGA